MTPTSAQLHLTLRSCVLDTDEDTHLQAHHFLYFPFTLLPPPPPYCLSFIPSFSSPPFSLISVEVFPSSLILLLLQSFSASYFLLSIWFLLSSLPPLLPSDETIILAQGSAGGIKREEQGGLAVVVVGCGGLERWKKWR